MMKNVSLIAATLLLSGNALAALLQEAFYLVTGYYPVTIQPWQRSLEDDDDTVTRREYLHMIDMHAALTQ